MDGSTTDDGKANHVHEFGLCEAVLQAIEARAKGRTVDQVTLRVGVLNRVVEDAFQQAFELVAAGSVAEHARIDLVDVPVTATCRDCGADVSSLDALPACTECGSVDLDITGGDELVVVSLTYAPAPTMARKGT